MTVGNLNSAFAPHAEPEMPQADNPALGLLAAFGENRDKAQTYLLQYGEVVAKNQAVLDAIRTQTEVLEARIEASRRAEDAASIERNRSIEAAAELRQLQSDAHARLATRERLLNDREAALNTREQDLTRREAAVRRARAAMDGL